MLAKEVPEAQRDALSLVEISSVSVIAMSDSADLLGLGEHCEEPSCNLVDFLPFKHVPTLSPPSLSLC